MNLGLGQYAFLSGSWWSISQMTAGVATICCLENVQHVVIALAGDSRSTF